MSVAQNIAWYESYCSALRSALLTIVSGTFSEVEAVQQRFKTHDPQKLQAMLDSAEQRLRELQTTGGRRGPIFRQGL